MDDLLQALTDRAEPVSAFGLAAEVGRSTHKVRGELQALKICHYVRYFPAQGGRAAGQWQITQAGREAIAGRRKEQTR